MNIDVASARMTKRGGGNSDHDYCARKSHTAALRVAVPGASRVVLHKFLLLLSCVTQRWW